MSVQVNEALRIHAVALSKIVDFTNYESILINGHNPKFKLGHAQSLEYIARIRGFNTRKGSEDKDDPLTPTQIKENFKAVFTRQFGSEIYNQDLNRLFTLHTSYLESQQWVLTDIYDAKTALGFAYIKDAKWNAVARVYLESQPDGWDDGPEKPQLLLSHLFTANALSHMTEETEDGFDLNELTFVEITKPVPNDLILHVTDSYQALSKSCFELLSLDSIMTTRVVDYLLAKANGELDSADPSMAKVNPKPDIKNKHYNLNLAFKELSIDHIRKTAEKTNFIFDIPHNIPNLEFGGDTFELLLNQIKNLNSFKYEQDYMALCIRQEGVSLNAWNYYLINYYNAVLDFSPIIFSHLAPREQFNFNNLFFDDFGRIFYKTDKPVQVLFMNEEFSMTENDFSILFSFLITKQVLVEKNLPFNLYMSFHHQLMIRIALQYEKGMDDFTPFKKIKLA